jgi:hypothetical protein
MAGAYRCSSDCVRNTNKQPTQDNTKPPVNRGGTRGGCTHRADEVVAYALGEGAVGQEERRRATMLVCRGRKTRGVSRADSSAVADEVFDETRDTDSQRVDDGEGPD